MTTRLELYNAALRLCGEQSISSLTEDREPRYLLDEVWSDGGVNACLEEGLWNWCAKVIQSTYDTDVTPSFGHNRAFSKPTDWVKTDGVWTDEFLTRPLLHYHEVTGYWYASIDQIYVRYISNDSAYGGDLSIWPQAFADYVAAHFAGKIAFKLTGSQEVEDKIIGADGNGGILKTRLINAKNLDASGSPTKIPPLGSWNRARSSLGGGRRDRGNRGSLIG